MTPDKDGYSVTARTFHWITAIIVLTALPIGILMNNLGEGPLPDFLYNLHRSLGAILLPIVAARLIWRIGHAPPPLPADIPPLQQFAAHATHWALYILLIVQPLVGWVATSAYRAPITLFWLVPLPPIWPEDRAFSERLFVAHKIIGITMALLIVAHIGAALFHHFVRRDDVLTRMVRGSVSQG